MGVSLRCIACLTIPCEAFAIAYYGILRYIISCWEELYVQGVVDTIATENVLHSVGVSLRCIACLTIPYKGFARAHESILRYIICCWEELYVQCVYDAIATENVLHSVSISLSCIASLAIPYEGFACAYEGILSYFVSCWENVYVQCVDQAIATKNVLLFVGVCLACVASHAMPCEALAVADSGVLCWQGHYLWQYSEVQGHYAIAAVYVLQGHAILACSSVYVTIPWVILAEADHCVLVGHWYSRTNGEVQGHYAIATVHVAQGHCISSSCVVGHTISKPCISLAMADGNVLNAYASRRRSYREGQYSSQYVVALILNYQCHCKRGSATRYSGVHASCIPCYAYNIRDCLCIDASIVCLDSSYGTSYVRHQTCGEYWGSTRDSSDNSICHHLRSHYWSYIDGVYRIKYYAYVYCIIPLEG